MEGVQRVKMFLVITSAYVLFWGPLFFVTLVNHPVVGTPLGHEVSSFLLFVFSSSPHFAEYCNFLYSNHAEVVAFSKFITETFWRNSMIKKLVSPKSLIPI